MGETIRISTNSEKPKSQGLSEYLPDPRVARRMRIDPKGYMSSLKENGSPKVEIPKDEGESYQDAAEDEVIALGDEEDDEGSSGTARIFIPPERQ